MKTLFLPCAAIALITGCAAPNISYLPADGYLVDVENGVMCKRYDCYQLGLIIPSYYEHEIANAYGLPGGKGYTWTTEQFTRLLIAPPEGLYKVEKLSETEYRLPINHATEMAYRTLHKEYDLLYNNIAL